MRNSRVNIIKIIESIISGYEKMTISEEDAQVLY